MNVIMKDLTPSLCLAKARYIMANTGLGAILCWTVSSKGEVIYFNLISISTGPKQ